MATRRPGLGNLRARNWRQKREAHLLDVRVRPHVSRRIAVNHSARWALALVGISVFFSALFFGIRAGANQLFLQNARYTIRNLQVETDGTLTRSQILALAQVSESDNLFQTNLDAVRDRLVARARVADAEVRRELPDTLILRVKERLPIAWVAPLADFSTPAAVLDDVETQARMEAAEDGERPAEPARPNALMVDADGLLLETDSLTAGFVGLPLIRLNGPHRLQAGTHLEDEGLTSALELLNCMQADLQYPFRVETIDATVGYSLVVENRLGTQITFGRKNLREQVARLNRLLGYAEAQGRQLASANLMARRNLPITFFPDGYQAQLSPTPTMVDGIPVRRAMPARADATEH